MNRKLFRVLILIVLTIGIFFRFTDLEGKNYWYDEVHTSITISGYSESEIANSEKIVKTISQPADLLSYQQIKPGSNVTDSVKRLVWEDPQHPPLYYILGRFWSQLVGTSPAAIRSLSSVISIVALPCVYWLCLELFPAPLTRWVALALAAISPFDLVYAQEARQYGLWMLLIIVSSTTFLRAVRVGNKFWWILYSISTMMGFYTFLFSILVAISHGIYLVINEGIRFTKTIKAFLISIAVSFALFSPWLIVCISQYSQFDRLTGWTQLDYLSQKEILEIWLHNISLIFLDLGGEYTSDHLWLYLPILGLTAYSTFFLCRNSGRQVWSFVLVLMLASSVPFALLDFVYGGVRSLTPRYLMPTYLSIQLSVAYFISVKLSALSIRDWHVRTIKIIFGTLIFLGIFSCIGYLKAETWWSKSTSQENVAISKIINQAEDSLVVSDDGTAYILSLAYLLEPDVKLLINPLCTNCAVQTREHSKLSLPKLPKEFKNVFILKSFPQESWKEELKSQFNSQLESVFEGGALWLWKFK